MAYWRIELRVDIHKTFAFSYLLTLSWNEYTENLDKYHFNNNRSRGLFADRKL